MIKKYNRIFVNLSTAAGDVLAIFIRSLLCELGPPCLPLSFAVILDDRGLSVWFSIFRFFPDSSVCIPLELGAQPIREQAARQVGSVGGALVPDGEEQGNPARDWLPKGYNGSPVSSSSFLPSFLSWMKQGPGK